MSAVHIIPDPARLEESLALAEYWDAGFEYNDFCEPRLLDDETAFRARIGLYRSMDRDRSRDTLHGAFLDVTVHSDDPLIRRVSEKRVLQSMEAARALGVRGVVFHTGLIPNFRSSFYTKNWLDRNRLFWSDICGRYPEIGVWMENMFDMDPLLLLALAESMGDDANFGICLDYAHALVFGGDPALWLACLAPYVRHMHINDNDGQDDLHDAVGDGIIDWVCFDRALREKGITPSVLIETKDLRKQRASLEYMRERRIYPFGQEGGTASC